MSSWGLPHNMAAGAPSAWWHGSLRLQCEGFPQARGKLHCFFWPSLGSHIVSLLLHFKGHKQVQTHPDSEGKELDCTCWWGHKKILENRAEWAVELQPSLENTMCYKMKQIRNNGDLTFDPNGVGSAPKTPLHLTLQLFPAILFPNFQAEPNALLTLAFLSPKSCCVRIFRQLFLFSRAPILSLPLHRPEKTWRDSPISRGRAMCCSQIPQTLGALSILNL